MVGFTDCKVTVIQSVPFSGWAFDELSVFGEFLGDIAFIKVAWYNNQGIRICMLHTQYLAGEHMLSLVDASLRRHIDQNK